MNQPSQTKEHSHRAPEQPSQASRQAHMQLCRVPAAHTALAPTTEYSVLYTPHTHTPRIQIESKLRNKAPKPRNPPQTPPMSQGVPHTACRGDMVVQTQQVAGQTVIRTAHQHRHLKRQARLAHVASACRVAGVGGQPPCPLPSLSNPSQAKPSMKQNPRP